MFRSTPFVSDQHQPPPAESPEPDRLEEDQQTLETVRQSLRQAGYWAYGTIDESNRWSIAVDDELGRVDVRIGRDGFEIQIRAESPGLYAEEDSPWRRQSRARLARLQIPRIARGFLEPHQAAAWDETIEGVVVTETVEMPFQRAEDISAFIRDRLPEIENLVTMIERQLG
jgi:type II secretory pathway component PulJ